MNRSPSASRGGRRPRADAARLPAYALYGEPRQAGLPDLLHVETIAHRSRQHDWEIRPHRHEALFQILVIAAGPVQVLLDGRRQALEGPCAISVPAMVAHGFGFVPSIDGVVITLPQAHLRSLVDAGAAWHAGLERPRVLPLAPAPLLQAAAELRDEHRSTGPWRAAALDSALRRLLLQLVRALPAPAPLTEGDEAPRALLHVQRYRALVDAQFRRQPALGELAAQLGITPTQLNRVCRRVLGQPALAVLHARLLLEAQRELGYTAMSVKQVAIGLGFADAGYFCRFFRRQAGCTPGAWRAAVATAPMIAAP